MEPDSNEKILAELQSLRRLARRALVTFLVLFATFVAGSVWDFGSRDGVYASANRALRVMDYDRAIRIAEKIAAEQPQDYVVHDYLGNVYLRSGSLSKAEEAYSRANELYPSEEISKILDSIRKTRTPPAEPTPQP